MHREDELVTLVSPWGQGAGNTMNVNQASKRSATSLPSRLVGRRASPPTHPPTPPGPISGERQHGIHHWRRPCGAGARGRGVHSGRQDLSPVALHRRMCCWIYRHPLQMVPQRRVCSLSTHLA